MAIEREGLHAYIPLPDYSQRTPFFSKEAFQYESEHDAYRCPNGALLPFKSYLHHEGLQRYRADATTCSSCPLKARCTDSDQGRTLLCSVHEAVGDRVRAYASTEAYRKALRKRSVWVEPLFAEGKQWHGMRRFRLIVVHLIVTSFLFYTLCFTLCCYYSLSSLEQFFASLNSCFLS